MRMKKNYQIEKYKSRESWLKARCIGGTDLCKLVNHVGRWGNFIELYDSLTRSEESVDKPNELMNDGRSAEENIKNLFLIAHKEFQRVNPPKSTRLIRRTDYNEITLSPDTLVRNEKKELGYIEIKYKEIYRESDIPRYLQELRSEEPQYYRQNVHYYITMNDLKFGYTVVAFNVKKFDKDKGTRVHDKFIIDSLKTDREALKEDIKVGEEALIDFITNNLRKRVRPSVKLKDSKEVKVNWNNWSSIQILKQ